MKNVFFNMMKRASSLHITSSCSAEQTILSKVKFDKELDNKDSLIFGVLYWMCTKKYMTHFFQIDSKKKMCPKMHKFILSWERMKKCSVLFVDKIFITNLLHGFRDL